MSPCPKCLVITGALNCSIVNSSWQQRLSSASPSQATGCKGREVAVVTCFWSHCKVNQVALSVVWALQSTNVLQWMPGARCLAVLSRAKLTLCVLKHSHKCARPCTEVHMNVHTLQETHRHTALFQSWLLLMEELLKRWWSKDRCSHRTFPPPMSNKIKQNVTD